MENTKYDKYTMNKYNNSNYMQNAVIKN